jgi:Carboxypeptidase regulatory-like domain
MRRRALQLLSPCVASFALALCLGGVAVADRAPTSQLSGRVLDRTNGGPVEGARVYVVGPDGARRVLTTDRAGRYAVKLPPAAYRLEFEYGKSRSTGQVRLEAGRPARVDGRVDSTSGEVIVIRERQRRRPAVLPRPINFSPIKAPPYSDRAIQSDAWTRAWLLLDVDETGAVTRFKFLKRPGYDLERIATREALQLRFEPGRDGKGRAVKTWVVWSIEWPAYWWLIEMNDVATRMPPLVGFPPRSMAANVPCRGSGPLNLGSVHPTYRDCSKPDLSRFAEEPWIIDRR